MVLSDKLLSTLQRDNQLDVLAADDPGAVFEIYIDDARFLLISGLSVRNSIQDIISKTGRQHEENAL